MPEGCVVLHDVQQNRLVTDANKRFGNRVGVSAQTHSETTAEEYDFHLSQLPRLAEPESQTCRPTRGQTTTGQ